MPEDVTVTVAAEPEPIPEPDTGEAVAFAAGVAVAEAEHAVEDAEAARQLVERLPEEMTARIAEAVDAATGPLLVELAALREEQHVHAAEIAALTTFLLEEEEEVEETTPSEPALEHITIKEEAPKPKWMGFYSKREAE